MRNVDSGSKVLRIASIVGFAISIFSFFFLLIMNVVLYKWLYSATLENVVLFRYLLRNT